MVGRADGLLDDTMVGFIDGIAVGFIEGNVVGTKDVLGPSVGDMELVGFAVAVGFDVGLTDGVEVGT